ncbi:hypothetical protein S7711_08456 [Stachybotrys chartarum IBT 7711]|uniref:H-type lectin domain-containing protein n=1 Tax=Stachybotrys chartarum (strain CBS 109288 / IBT 7711) TaxID=1280523 RepID=A0A084AGG6_STACB|nr:hypothetical protein S7711_08456 [Stachybotrys chartarum IBT 7711]
MAESKTFSFSNISKNLKQTDSSNQIRLMWPDDYVSIGPDDPFVSVEEKESCGGDGRPLEWEEGRMRRMLVRPKVTVNVFNTGGSSLGGSGSAAGGLGAGGAATVNDGYDESAQDAIHALASQLAAVSEKVEQLSLLATTRGATIKSGTWSTNDVRPWSQPRHQTEGRITFAEEFKSIPRVTTGITKLDISNQANSRVQVSVTDIDEKGFTIHADSWADTELYSNTQLEDMSRTHQEGGHNPVTLPEFWMPQENFSLGGAAISILQFGCPMSSVSSKLRKMLDFEFDSRAPDNAFETDVDRFWGIPSARNYMQSRFALAVEHLVQMGTLEGVLMGVRNGVPALMLRLDLDQECYDSVKWCATVRSWPRIASISNCGRELKWPSSGVHSVKLQEQRPAVLAMTERNLVGQKIELDKTVTSAERNIVLARFKSHEALSSGPGEFTFDAEELTARVGDMMYTAWWETQGVWDLLTDVSACAAQHSEQDLAGLMEIGAPNAKAELRLPLTFEQLLEAVSARRVWLSLDFALHNASYFGPWSKRPSERYDRIGRKFAQMVLTMLQSENEALSKNGNRND